MGTNGWHKGSRCTESTSVYSLYREIFQPVQRVTQFQSELLSQQLDSPGFWVVLGVRFPVISDSWILFGDKYRYGLRAWFKNIFGRQKTSQDTFPLGIWISPFEWNSHQTKVLKIGWACGANQISVGEPGFLVTLMNYYHAHYEMLECCASPQLQSVL